ncbi:MAG: hypothetical protein WCA19_14535 [Candidatus Acidiferrales bacterium]
MSGFLRRLVFLTIFTAVGISFAAQSQPFSTPEKGLAKQEGSKDGENPARSNKDQKAAPNVTVIVNQEKPAPHESDESKNSEDIKIQRQLARFTGGLVIVGFIQAVVLALTLVAIIIQAVLMGKHAGHLKNLAAETKNNANAFINSQRAWMVGTKPGYDLEMESGKVANIVYQCSVANVGKTLSRISEIGVTLRKTESLEKIPADPTPTYQSEEVRQFNRIIVVPDDFIRVRAKLSQELTWKENADIKDRKSFVYAYGFVKYLDVSGESRETRFCHRYSIATLGEFSDSDVFEPCIQAPPEYHKAT